MSLRGYKSESCLPRDYGVRMPRHAGVRLETHLRDVHLALTLRTTVMKNIRLALWDLAYEVGLWESEWTKRTFSIRARSC